MQLMWPQVLWVNVACPLCGLPFLPCTCEHQPQFKVPYDIIILQQTLYLHCIVYSSTTYTVNDKDDYIILLLYNRRQDGEWAEVYKSYPYIALGSSNSLSRIAVSGMKIFGTAWQFHLEIK